MAKRINIYLSDKDTDILWDISGRDLVSLAIQQKLGNRNMGDSISGDLISLIYNDTQFIVNSIKAKAEKPKEWMVQTADSKNFMTDKKPMSEKQAMFYQEKFNSYKKNFDKEKSRGTDSKLIDTLYVFEPWNNELNQQLWIDLWMLVLEHDVDWTEYMDQTFYNYLN